jgi:hypothetical protein
MNRLTRTVLSLTPGFSPVPRTMNDENRFNGFSPARHKPFQRLGGLVTMTTGLKPGVNENLNSSLPACFHPELN